MRRNYRNRQLDSNNLSTILAELPSIIHFGPYILQRHKLKFRQVWRNLDLTNVNSQCHLVSTSFNTN